MSAHLAVLLLSTVQALANQEVPAQLPARIIEAKAVFIDNRSGCIRARDEFANELGKWNRFRIVYNKGEADVVVVLAVQTAARTTRLNFVDPATGATLWTNSMPWSDRGAVRDLLGDLKARIEEQEHHPGK